MNLTITLNHDTAHPVATLRLEGELDFTTITSAVDAARRLLADAATLTALHLDCAELTFCDSAGLAGLLDIHGQAQARGVRLHLDNRPTQLDRLLDITGTFDHLVATAEAGADADADADSEESELG